MRDWIEYRWEEVLTIKNGKNQKKVINPNGKYPIYGSGGIMGYADDFLCLENTTIIGRKGSINNPIYVKEKFWNVDTAFGLCSNEKLDSKFFFYFCKNYNFFKHNKATTLPSLTKADLLKIKIHLPSLPIQKQIAEILDTANALRQETKAQLADLDVLAQSVFLEIFGDPVLNEKGFEKKTLGALSTVFRDGPFGSNLKSAHYTDKGVRIIRLKNIGVGEFVDTDKAFVSVEHYENVLSKHSCRKGDVLFGTLGEPNLRACHFPENIELAVNKADCLQFRPKNEELKATFLVHLINSKGIQNSVKNLVHGQTRGRISKGQLTNFEIPVPPLDLQTQFAQIIQNIESQKAELKQSLQESEDLFNGLLQEVFG